MRVRRRRKARGSVPGGHGACAASQRRASRDKKSQLYETQSHKKHSTFTTKISVTVFRRSPSPAAAPMHIRFSHFASRKAQSREHTLTAPARARWFTARRRNAVLHPPSLPPQLHVGLHRVRRWRTVRARPPDPRPSRGRQRPRFLQRFRVDYPSALPAPVARARRRDARSASRAARPPAPSRPPRDRGGAARVPSRPPAAFDGPRTRTSSSAFPPDRSPSRRCAPTPL